MAACAGLLDMHAELVHLEGLQEVANPELVRACDDGVVRGTREDQHPDRRPPLARELDEVEARAIRQAHVDDQRIEASRRER